MTYWESVLVYIDILVFSDSFANHVQHVKEVLQRLRRHNLFGKGEKCSFHQREVSFLGYKISPQGVVMEKQKTSAVRSWPVPTTVKGLQSFLGFANFYCRFIRNFSSIAAPLTSLLKGPPKKLDWTPDAVRAFHRLKIMFTSAPVLKHPDPSKPFVLEVDASEVGVGAILSQQQGKPEK